MFKALVFSCTSTDIEEIMKKIKGGSRATATSKMERFVIKVNFITKRFQPLTIITKRSILDVAAALDLPLSLT